MSTRLWMPATAALVAAAGVLGAFFVADRGPDKEIVSRAIAAKAQTELDSRFDTGLLLSLAAWKKADTPEARDVALKATQRSDRMRALVRNRSGTEVTAVAQGGNTLAVADGAAVALFDGRRRLNDRLTSPDGSEPVAIAVGAGGGRTAAAFGNEVVLQARGNSVSLDGRVTALAFDASETRLAGVGHGELRVWDAATGRTIYADTVAAVSDGTAAADVVFDGDRLGEIRGGGLSIWNTATWQREDREVALGDGAVLSPDLRRVTDGRVVTQIATGGTVALVAPGTHPVFSPDSRRVAVVAADGAIVIHDVVTGARSGAPLRGGNDAVALDWPTNGLLISGGRSGLTTTWNPVRPDESKIGSMVAHGKTGALAWFNGGYLAVDEVPYASRVERAVNGHALAFAPEGDTLVIAEDHRIRRFDLRLQARGQHITSAPVTALATGPDNRVAYGDQQGQIHVWTAGGELASSRSTLGAPGPIGAIAFSRDGGRLAAAVGSTVQIHGVVGDRLPDGPLLRGHDAPISAVAFSPDNRLVATTGEDATTRLWSARTGQRIATLPARARNSALAFTPDGKTLATAQDTTITLYDIATRRQLGDPLPANAPGQLAFAPDGRTLVAGGIPLARFPGRDWAATPDEIARSACAIVGRDLREAELPEDTKASACR